MLERVKSTYQTHPQLSNACTGFVTFTMGDVIAQKLDSKNESVMENHIDIARSLELGMLGFVMNGFFLHRWFVLLDKVVPKVVASSRGAVFAKVAADQLVYAPFAILSFFGYACAFRPPPLADQQQYSGVLEAVKARVRSDFVHTYIADCMLWPLANYVNFRFVPLVFRASFTAVTQLAWQTYLSVVTHVAHDAEHRHATVAGKAASHGEVAVGQGSASERTAAAAAGDFDESSLSSPASVIHLVASP